jgi:hypothetical protein
MARSRTANPASDILNDLGALAAAPKVKSSGKPNKWELPLTPQAKAEALRWINAKTILDPIEKRAENAKGELNEYCLGILADKIWETGNKPSNPMVVILKDDGVTVDHEFTWLASDKFKVRFPDCPEGTDNREHLVKVIEDIGFHPEDAANLVDNELDFAAVVGFRSLTELLEGRYGEGREWLDSTEAEKAAGRKLAALIRWTGEGDTPEPLSVGEKGIVLDRSQNVQVKAGFWSRMKTYCRSEQQVRDLFKVIQPVVYPAHLKFAKNDSVTDVANRKIAAAAEILGV